MQVNAVQLPKSDLMASNGVIHVTKSLLYPEGVACNNLCYVILLLISNLALSHLKNNFCADVPLGSQEILTLLRRFIRYIQIKVPKFKLKTSNAPLYGNLIYMSIVTDEGK